MLAEDPLHREAVEHGLERLALADHEAGGRAVQTRLVVGDAEAGRPPPPLHEVDDPPQSPPAVERHLLADAPRVPAGPGIRDDGGVEGGDEVSIYYDPLISKLIAWGEDRPHCIARMLRALAEYEVLGITTTIPFFRWMLSQPAFLEAAFHTTYLDEVLQQRRGEPFSSPDVSLEEVAAIAAALCQPAPGGMNGSAAGEPATGAGLSSAWAQRARVEGLRQ